MTSYVTFGRKGTTLSCSALSLRAMTARAGEVGLRVVKLKILMS